MIAKSRAILGLEREREGFLVLSLAAFMAVAAGYALATRGMLVGAAVAFGAAAVGIATWPVMSLIALALPYVLSEAVFIGGLRARDLTVSCFAIAVLAGIRVFPISGRALLVLVLDLAFAATVLVSATGFLGQPGEMASLAEIGGSLFLLVAGVALGAMTGLGPTLRTIRLIVWGVAVAALITWILQNGSPLDWNTFADQARAGTGAILGANGLGAFLAIGAVMEITLRRASLMTPRSLLLCGLLVGVVFLSGSRGAVLVLGLGLLPLAIRTQRRMLAFALAGLLIAAAAWSAVTLTSVRAASVERLGGNPAGVLNAPALRVDAARLAVHLMAEHPLTGVGYGQVQSFATSDPQLGAEFDTHDEYLRIGAESGIPALVLLLSLLGVCLLTGVQSTRRNETPAAFGATAALAAFALSLLTVQGFHIFELSAPWMLLAGAIVGTAEGASSRQSAVVQDVPASAR